MREGGTFPADMAEAIKNRHIWPLSCCVLWPGHQMDLPGSVGIIFRVSEGNVVSVSSSDSGSFTGPDGRDHSLGLPLSPITFEETFNPTRGGYNEWRVLGAEVVGIFVSDPTLIHVKRPIELSSGDVRVSDIGATPVSLEYVLGCFPEHDFFTLGLDELTRIPRSVVEF